MKIPGKKYNLGPYVYVYVYMYVHYLYDFALKIRYKPLNKSLKFWNSISGDGVDLSCQEPVAVADTEES